MPTQIKIFTLSTCSHCTQAKEYLDERVIPYDNVHVDLMSGEDRTQTIDTLRKINPKITFPTIVIGDKVIVGFLREEIEATLREYNMETAVQASTWQQP